RDPAWADEVARGLVPWGWLVLLVGPPLLVWRRRRRALALDGPTTATPAAPERLTQLGRLEREFHAVLASHVPDQPARDGDGLARALRAAGVDSAVADHVKRLRDRLRAAADSLGARAAGEPRVPAHWYNLGATLYRAGADGKATAAWARAARLAPRDPLVRRVRELLPAPDAASEALLTTGLATPGEW